jgi:hypothetical protein
MVAKTKINNKFLQHKKDLDTNKHNQADPLLYFALKMSFTASTDFAGEKEPQLLLCPC